MLLRRFWWIFQRHAAPPPDACPYALWLCQLLVWNINLHQHCVKDQNQMQNNTLPSLQGASTPLWQRVQFSSGRFLALTSERWAPPSVSSFHQKAVWSNFGFRLDGRAACPTLGDFLAPSCLEQYPLRSIWEFLVPFLRGFDLTKFSSDFEKKTSLPNQLPEDECLHWVRFPSSWWETPGDCHIFSGMLWLSYVTDNPDLCVAILSIRCKPHHKF